MPDERCRATYEHKITYMDRWVGVQCKYTQDHKGRHCGYTGYNDGDVFWTDAPPPVPRVPGKKAAS